MIFLHDQKWTKKMLFQMKKLLIFIIILSSFIIFAWGQKIMMKTHLQKRNTGMSIRKSLSYQLGNGSIIEILILRLLGALCILLNPCSQSQWIGYKQRDFLRNVFVPLFHIWHLPLFLANRASLNHNQNMKRRLNFSGIKDSSSSLKLFASTWEPL